MSNDCEAASKLMPTEEKLNPIRIKYFVLEVNGIEVEVSAKDVLTASNSDSPWVLRRLSEDEDILKAALLKTVK